MANPVEQMNKELEQDLTRILTEEIMKSGLKMGRGGFSVSVSGDGTGKGERDRGNITEI